MYTEVTAPYTTAKLWYAHEKVFILKYIFDHF